MTRRQPIDISPNRNTPIEDCLVHETGDTASPPTRPVVRPERLRSRGRPHDGPGQAHAAANAEDGRSRAGAGPPARHVGKPGGSMRSADRGTLPTATDPRPRDRDLPDPAVSGQAPGHTFPIDIDAAKGPPQPRSETGQPWEADQSYNGNVPVVPSFPFRDFNAGSPSEGCPSPAFTGLSAIRASGLLVRRNHFGIE